LTSFITVRCLCSVDLGRQSGTRVIAAELHGATKTTIESGSR